MNMELNIVRDTTQARVCELVETMAESIRATAQRLYASGAIDLDDYNNDDGYALAKILVTAATRQHTDDFAPIHNKDWVNACKNLENF